MFGCIIHLTTGFQANVTTMTSHRGTTIAQLAKIVYQSKTRTIGRISQENVDGPSHQKRWHLPDLDIIRVNREGKVEQNLHKKPLTEICHLMNLKTHNHQWMNPTAMSHHLTHQTQEEKHLL